MEKTDNLAPADTFDIQRQVPLLIVHSVFSPRDATKSLTPRAFGKMKLLKKCAFILVTVNAAE